MAIDPDTYVSEVARRFAELAEDIDAELAGMKASGPYVRHLLLTKRAAEFEAAILQRAVLIQQTKAGG